MISASLREGYFSHLRDVFFSQCAVCQCRVIRSLNGCIGSNNNKSAREAHLDDAPMLFNRIEATIISRPINS